MVDFRSLDFIDQVKPVRNPAPEPICQFCHQIIDVDAAVGSDAVRFKGLDGDAFMALVQNDVSEHRTIGETLIGDQKICVKPVRKAQLVEIRCKSVLPQGLDAEIRKTVSFRLATTFSIMISWWPAASTRASR